MFAPNYHFDASATEQWIVGFICKKKKRRIDFGHHDSKPHAYVKLQNMSQVHIHESSSQILDFHFFTYLRPNNEGEEKDWSRASPENKCPQN